MFWHSFDLALTRFSGKRVTPREGAGMVEREAYSHEVISFGFWFGDDKTFPLRRSIHTPHPNLRAWPTNRSSPSSAKWQESNGSHMALLMYDDVRGSANAREQMLSSFSRRRIRPERKRAEWDIET